MILNRNKKEEGLNNVMYSDSSSNSCLRNSLDKAKWEYVQESEKILHLDYLISCRNIFHNINLPPTLVLERNISYNHRESIKRSIASLSRILGLEVVYPLDNKYGNIIRNPCFLNLSLP